jgi:hypothetical protein
MDVIFDAGGIVTQANIFLFFRSCFKEFGYVLSFFVQADLDSLKDIECHCILHITVPQVRLLSVEGDQKTCGTFDFTECHIIFFTFYWDISLPMLFKSKVVFETGGRTFV